MKFTLKVNGARYAVDTDPDRPLLEVLREDLHLTGTKYGCGEGHCRACAVLIDGRAVTSCRMPVRSASGAAITTIEGLAASPGTLHNLQQAFVAEGAISDSRKAIVQGS